MLSRIHGIHAAPAGEAGGGDVACDDVAAQPMTKEHAAAFKRVMEKRRIVWCDHAAAFQV